MSEITNARYAETESTFRAACKEADLPPTKRQAGKYRRKVGIAWTTRCKLLTLLPDQIVREEKRIDQNGDQEDMVVNLRSRLQALQ